MNVDQKFEAYFRGRLQQVFFYITDRCNLACQQCLYKTTLANREMDEGVVMFMLRLFHQYGARKLTLIGGEPTLFGIRSNREPLFRVLETARGLGFEYVRIDTNGQFEISLLKEPAMKNVSNLAFSLDGHTRDLNDGLRGKGTFDKCVAGIAAAADLGYYATVTCCVDRRILSELEAYIEFVKQLGAREVNFHPLFKVGIARDLFAKGEHIEPQEWMPVYASMKAKADAGHFGIPVRLPQRFVSRIQYNSEPEAYGYCPVRLAERILVHPDGTIRICALCIGSDYHLASYTSDGIVFGALHSEISEDRLKRVPCLSQTRDFNDLVPLCISYKPEQNEFVWIRNGYNDTFRAGAEGRLDPAQEESALV